MVVQPIADYNKIVSASLTPPILEYELNRVAASPNAKTVVIGAGSSGGQAPPLLLQTPAAREQSPAK